MVPSAYWTMTGTGGKFTAVDVGNLGPTKKEIASHSPVPAGIAQYLHAQGATAQVPGGLLAQQANPVPLAERESPCATASLAAALTWKWALKSQSMAKSSSDSGCSEMHAAQQNMCTAWPF